MNFLNAGAICSRDPCPHCHRPNIKRNGNEAAGCQRYHLKHGEDYVAQGMAEYEQAYCERTVQNSVRKTKALGYKLLPTTDSAMSHALARPSLLERSSPGGSSICGTNNSLGWF